MEIEELEFFKKVIALPFVEKVYLFGSRARGEGAKRADIDLAIVCPQASDEQWNRMLELVAMADTLLEIDCVRFDQIKKEQFKQAILKDHRVLFERRKHASTTPRLKSGG